jgi:hypothetical protein
MVSLEKASFSCEIFIPLEQINRKYIVKKFIPFEAIAIKKSVPFVQRDIDKAIHSPRKNNPTEANRGKGD